MLFLDKDITLPGDFKTNLDQIVDELEKQLGISSAPDDFEYYGVPDNSVYYDPKDENGFGPDPWAGMDIGTRIPIFIVTDRVPVGRISCATAESAVLCIYELFSEELWNSIPEFRDNPWRRGKSINYMEIAHELTHTITQRNCDMDKIQTEGIAQYMQYSVLEALSGKNKTFAEVLNEWEPVDGNVTVAVNETNAESIFLSDCSDIDHDKRGMEYYYGRRLWQYVNEKNGPDFFAKYYAKLKAENMGYYNYDYKPDSAIVKKYCDFMKELYGEDLFTGFGKWCVKNDYLQNVWIEE